ncbi:hypothetical protein [Mesorhizobium sp. NBSH29]|uniref:hypothetical protein n=1 Tax=Mesorhizobium sp. NBSH29 TaxID=2654249 RepID=UPI001AEF2EB2|nr:hypothetical protein [Mesorhizobium sp. NBSH29]
MLFETDVSHARNGQLFSLVYNENVARGVHRQNSRGVCRLKLVIHAPDDHEVAAGALRTAGPHVRVHWTPGLGHRRILADADVVAETVSFVGAENRSLAA